MKTNPITLMTTAALIAAVSSQAHAQWSNDSTVHHSVADGEGEQVQPKIVSTFDGGCYISWFSSADGYDVRLQRLDSSGNEMWAHNGVLIADRNFSSTQSYDLDIDITGHAVIVFRDDRFGGTKITAQRIAPDGTATWGPDGIQFGNGTDFVASPDIATTDDGFTIIGWINTGNTHLAKISAAGMTMWNTVLSDPGGDSINLASMHRSDGNSIIVSWVQYTSFFDPKHLFAQKINADGSGAWASPVPVFDGGSLQFATYPEFVSDGSGGAVFSWYDTANSIDVYAQHIASDGTELFAHDGVLVSTFPSQRVSPAVNFDQATDSIYIAWTELANNQGDRGIFAQRIDSKGSRLWTERGIELSPVDANDSGSINVQISGGNMTTLWIENTGGFGFDQIHARALTPAGDDAWVNGTIVMTSDFSLRSRLVSTTSSDDFVIAGWQFGDFGIADIQTHNINTNGTLGESYCPGDLTGDGVVNFFDISAFLNAYGAQDPIADFNNDGKLNYFDISAFLSAFGVGCP